MGVVFDQAHATMTVLLYCMTVFVACGLTKSRVLFTPPRPILHPNLFLNENIFFYLLVTLLSLHNIIKLHYETF